MMNRTVLLVRHGDLGESFLGRYIGATDIPLSDLGRSQVEVLRQKITAIEPDLCLCSPLRRCRETAAILFGSKPSAVEIDTDLREIDFGHWESLTFGEISASFPEAVVRWAAFEDDFAFPGGEAMRHFLARVDRIAAMLSGTGPGTSFLITHGGVIRFLICRLLQLEPRQHVLFEIPHASVTTIRMYNGKGTLALGDLSVQTDVPINTKGGERKDHG